MANTSTVSNTLSFEPMRKALSRTLDLGAFADSRLEASVRQEQFFNGMVYELRTQVLARKLVGDSATVYFYSPTTAWQMLKEQYAPRWFVKRYPVKKKQHKRTVKFTRYATYPMADVVLPEKFGRAVVFESFDGADRG